jgi:uncharacterized membrane protein
MTVDRPAPLPENGKTSALVIYVLYLLSLPSIGLLMFAGVIFAYIQRGSSTDWVRTHYDHLIKTFWVTFWLTALGILIAVIAVPLMLVLIGFAIWWALGVAGAILAIWFHLVSLIGLLRLVQDKPY